MTIKSAEKQAEKALSPLIEGLLQKVSIAAVRHGASAVATVLATYGYIDHDQGQLLIGAAGGAVVFLWSVYDKWATREQAKTALMDVHGIAAEAAMEPHNWHVPVSAYPNDPTSWEQAPGHEDMMIAPEDLDRFMEQHPLPEDDHSPMQPLALPPNPK